MLQKFREIATPHFVSFSISEIFLFLFLADRSTSRMMYSFFYQVCTDIFEDIPSAFISVMLISISGEKWSSPTNILTFINILSSFVGTFLSMAEIVVQFYLEDFVIAQSQIGSSRESDDVDPVCTAIVFFIIYFFPYFFIFVFTPLIFASKMTQVVLLNNSTCNSFLCMYVRVCLFFV